jgi:serine/threonine protein kinase/Tfp pilus assembly protein PilF
MIGKTIFHYQILEKLGEGGMGVVYKAQDTKLDRLVALKFLPRQFSVNQEEKSRFIHEARAAAALDHPNICSIHEINETEDGQMYIAMGYYEGQTLKEKIEKGPLKIEDAIKTALQIAEGLGKAHKREIVHRDIKTANIILTREGEVKILDFGLAKLKGYTKLTKEGTTMGTVAYMSPEQATGDEADHRSDIWSLGVVLYEMVTGQLPFKGEYEQAIMYAITHDEPEPVTGLRTGLPLELERIINKILSKDPSERYQHTDDLIVDLRKLKKDTQPEASTISKESGPVMPRKPFRKMLVPGSIFLGVLLLIGLYFLFKEKSPPKNLPIKPGDKPLLAVVHFENKSGDPNLDNWRDALSELLTTDLSQSKYIRVLRSDQLYGILKKLDILNAPRYSEQDFKELANIGGLSHILKGSFIKAGNNFVITATLFNTSSGETIHSMSVKAEGEKDIFPQVDTLTKALKKHLYPDKINIDFDVDRNVGEITTSSPEAYITFIKGLKLYYDGKFRQFISILHRVLAMDPEFALAYRYLAMAFRNIGYESEFQTYIKKGIQFMDRLSDRERYHILGPYYMMTYMKSKKHLDHAIDLWKKLLSEYPDDHIGIGSLEQIYENLEQFDQGIRLLESKGLDKNDLWWTHNKLANNYNSTGQYAKAQAVLEKYLNTIQDHYFIRAHLSKNFIIQGKFDLALIEAERAISLSSEKALAYLYKGDIAMFTNNLQESENCYQMFGEAEEKTDQAMTLLRIGALHLLQGKLDNAGIQFDKAESVIIQNNLRLWILNLEYFQGYVNLKKKKMKEALEVLDKTLEIINQKEMDETDQLVWLYYFKALAGLETGSEDQVKRVEKALSDCIDLKLNKKLIRFYYLFMGQKALKQNHYFKAIELLSKAIPLLPCQNYYDFSRALFLEPLARVYRKSGNIEKSIQEYEKITRLTSGRLYFGDIYARAFYQLGKIYEQKGWKGKAIENYNKFIKLWKDCDSIFQPMVDDARKRVKELEEI